jgi:hypothetical protein
MTNQEINERVAKLCGWGKKPFVYGSMDENDNPIEITSNAWHKDGEGFRCFERNYAESLDACLEFINQLHGGDRDDFVSIVTSMDRIGFAYDSEVYWALITLTPLELCEAFLRMKGQWE